MPPIARVAGRAVLIVAVTLGLAVVHPVPSSAAGMTITILESYDPDTVTVAPGTTITWVNESGNRHRVRTTSGPGEFDSGDLDPGEQFSVTLSAVGTYAYRDDRNPDDSAFWAEIVVAKAAATATPRPSAGTPTPTPAPPTGDVRMAGRTFKPAKITIVPGGSVTWLNDDGRDHTVTASNNAFDSGTLRPGQSYKRAFPNAGTYAYFCVIHPDMTGSVVVTAPGATPAPTPAPTPTPRPTPVSTPAPGSIRAIDYAFQPMALAVAAGSRVTVVNAGRAPHTMTARDGSFDSGTIAAGSTWAHTFSTPGTFSFLCSIHPDMTGTLTVTGVGGSAPPPAPTTKPSPTAKPPTGPPPGGSVRAIDYAFQPTSLTVTVGTRVSFANVGRAPHTMTARDGSFDSGLIAAGGRWARTFSTSGTFQFLCTLHPQMTGSVRVTDASGNAPPPAATSAPTVRPGGPAASGSLAVLDFRFDPSSISVPIGTTLRWVNAGVAPHTVTDRGGSFDSGFIAGGDSWSHRFDQPGTFPFWCVIHPDMTGVLEVTPAGAVAAPSVAPGGPSGSALAPSPSSTANTAAVIGSGAGGTGAAEPAALAGPAAAVLPARETTTADYLGIAFAFLLTGVGALLFTRTIRGAVRRPDLQ